MIELAPENLIITAYNPNDSHGLKVGVPNGVSVYHKPTDTTWTCDTERSQYKNRANCLHNLKVWLESEGMTGNEEQISCKSLELIVDYIEGFGEDASMEVVKSELQELIARAKGEYL